jgi:adenylate cyclase
MSQAERASVGEGMGEFAGHLKKHWRAAMLGALIAGVAGALLMSDLGRNLHQWSYDLPFRIRGPVFPQEAAMIYMDEQSHDDLHQPYDKPWDRSLHAQLLDRLTACQVKGVVFDVVFSGEGSDPKANAQLIDAIKKNGHVILAADYRTGGFGNATVEHEKKFDLPYKPFFRAAEGRCGSDFIYTDNDEVPRRHLPADPDNDQLSSEGWTAAELVGADVTKQATNKYTPFYLNYYGPSGTIPADSFSRVLRGEVSPDFYRGKMVFVGARYFTKYSGERKDEYPTPYSYYYPDKPMTSGVEIQATAYLNLVRNERLLRLPVGVEVPLVIFCGALIGFGLTLLAPLAASFTAVGAALAVAAINFVLFQQAHRWFSWEVIVLGEIPLAWAYSVAFNSLQLYVEKLKVEQSLALYLSPKMIRKIARDPKMLAPGAEKQLLTILFTDIANFTAISEGLDSNDLAHSMNAYFQAAVHNCIFPTDGTVVKYIGDAIFAFWNAPDPQPDHAIRACEAALRFRDQPPLFMNGQELTTRIGLHTGPANVGNFGSRTRFDYTALGENINLASRMEGLNKYLGTRILITEETQQFAGAKIITRFLGVFRLKGFERAVAVHELVGLAHQEKEGRELRGRFSDALTRFREGDLAGAEAAFRRVLELQAGDGPSQFYLAQVEEWRGQTLPSNWEGEIALKEK